MTIRPELAGDHDAIRHVVSAAFASDAEALLVELIRASPEYEPEMALVAEIDGEIVGHVMVSGAVIRSADYERPVCVLSPLAVQPGSQGEGVGSALVRSVLAIADRRGEPIIILERDPAYYSRFGFEPAATYGIKMALPDWAPAEAAQVVRLSSFDPSDRAIRGSVVYPKAFDVVE